MTTTNLRLHLTSMVISGCNINDVTVSQASVRFVVGIESADFGCYTTNNVPFGDRSLYVLPTSYEDIRLPALMAEQIVRYFRVCFIDGSCRNYDCHSFSFYASDPKIHRIKPGLSAKYGNDMLYKGPERNLQNGRIYRIIRNGKTIVHSFIGTGNNTALAILLPGYPMILSTRLEHEHLYSGESYLYIG